MSDTFWNEHRLGECSETDRVLSTFLDGESIGELDYLELEALREHRDACAACRRALDAARRLDAELAQLAHVDLECGGGVEFLDAMFEAVDIEDRSTAVVGGEVSTAPVVAGNASRALFLAVAAGVVLGGLGTWFAFGRDDGAVAPEDVVPGLVQGPSDPATGSPSPLVASGHGLRSPEQQTVVPDEDVPDESTRLRRRGDVVRRVWRPGLEARRIERLTAAVQSDALPTLRGIANWLPGSLGSDFEVWVEGAAEQAARTLAGGRGLEVDRALLMLAARDGVATAESLLGRRMGELLQRARSDRSIRRLLLAMESRRVDETLLDWADGSVERTEELAVDLLAVAERPGRAPLLLELWQDLSGRTDIDELDLAERWFSGLDTRAAIELAEVVDRTRNQVQRRRAVLACAAIGDPAVSDSLRRVFTGPNRRLRSVAGYALGRLPSGSDGFDHQRLSRSLGAARAAVLASRRDVSIQGAIDTLALSDEERTFLISGRFDPEQFEVATALFHSRSGSAIGGF